MPYLKTKKLILTTISNINCRQIDYNEEKSTYVYIYIPLPNYSIYI